MKNSFDKVNKTIDDSRFAREIHQYLDKYRPKTEEFSDVYDEQTLAQDQQEIIDFEQKKGITHEEDKLTDGICLEYIFANLDMNDFFMEDNDRYDEIITEEGDYLMKVIPAHKYDDIFHNVDMICVMRNELTDHQTIPFIIDCTSNSSKINQKLNYRRTDAGLKGFTKLFYFKNPAETDEGDTSIAKGNIDIIPRFVLGVDSDKARKTAKYQPGLPAHNLTWEEEAELQENKECYSEIRLCIFEELNKQCDMIN